MELVLLYIPSRSRDLSLVIIHLQSLMLEAVFLDEKVLQTQEFGLAPGNFRLRLLDQVERICPELQLNVEAGDLLAVDLARVGDQPEVSQLVRNLLPACFEGCQYTFGLSSRLIGLVREKLKSHFSPPYT